MFSKSLELITSVLKCGFLVWMDGGRWDWGVFYIAEFHHVYICDAHGTVHTDTLIIEKNII